MPSSRRRLRAVGAALRPAGGTPIKVVSLPGGRHFCLDQSTADAKQLAEHLPWYGPDYSPHDVPAFYDVSGLTESPAVFARVIEILVERYRGSDVTAVAGFDARGFLFGPPLAQALGVKFVMVRKAGKLPGVLVSTEYTTEYSADAVVMRLGSVTKDDRVVLVDDLIATGGTAIAGFELVEQLGATVVEFAAVVCLPGLGGVEAIHSHKEGRFRDVPIFTLVDDAIIGPENCRDPPLGTPRIIPALQAASASGQIVASPPPCSASDSPQRIEQVLQCPTARRDDTGEFAIKIGIIGGSGLDNPDILQGVTELRVETPFGPPSDVLLCGTIASVDCVLIARHGRGHTIMPTNVNFRANVCE